MPFIALVVVGTVAVAQKDGGLRHPDPAVLATEHVREILLVMNPDRNGNITREQWLQFMAAEFDHLDSDRKGAIEPRKLIPFRESRRHNRFSDFGK
jgi:hypothetical protein